MSGFVYFFPGINGKPTRAQIEAAGLGYAFEKEQYPVCPCHSGPEGMKGVCIGGAGTDSAKTGYHADKQTWRRVPKSDAWVGFYTDDPPGPKDLARDTQLPGHWVKLPDGNDWLCPVARLLNGGCNLPQQIDIDDEGNWLQGGVIEQYAKLWAIGCAFWDAIPDPDAPEAEEAENKSEIQFDFAGANDAAVECLIKNYRVSKIECVQLGVITEEAATQILLALIDWPTLEEYVKKNGNLLES